METDYETFETDKPRSPLGWLKGIGWCLLVLSIFVAVFVAWNHGKGTSKLQQTLAELDRTEPGWRLEDIEAARAEIPDEENSARVVVAAAELIPRGWPTQELTDRFTHLEPQEQLADDDFTRLRAELNRVRPALDVACKLADMPRGRHHLHFARNPIETLLPDQQKSREIVNLLVYEAMRQSQQGEAKNALASCRAALNAARSLGDEPIFISQLIRFAGVVHTCQAIERTLAQGEPPPEDMAALQKLLEDEDALPSLLIALRGERASLHKVFEGVEKGEVSVDNLAQTRSEWWEKTFISLWRMDTRQDHALALSLMARRLKENQFPMHEQAAMEKEFEQEVRKLPTNAVITRLLLPAMSKVGEAFRRKQACLRCAMVALAAERYYREKRAWPDSVKQLCPQYLAAMPLDPYDGARLRYRRIKDGVIVYSIGQDAIDNGGNLDRESPIKPGTDIGFRLWDATKRRQPPRPKPPKP